MSDSTSAFGFGSRPCGGRALLSFRPTNVRTRGPSGQTTVATLAANCTKSAAPTPLGEYLARLDPG